MTPLQHTATQALGYRFPLVLFRLLLTDGQGEEEDRQRRKTDGTRKLDIYTLLR